MNIVQMIERPDLFGAMADFADLSSWRNWLAILKAIDGLRMTAEERATVERFSGRGDFGPGRVQKRVIFVTGRQCAKSRMSSLLAVHAALTQGKPGQYVPILAQDRVASMRVLFGYVREALTASPVLRAEVIRETADTIELRNGVTLAVYPSRAASLRGIRSPFVAADEIAFASAGVDGLDRSREIVTACEPCTATTDGRVVLLSSPGRAGDHFHQLVGANYGREGAEWFVIRAKSPDLNPTLGEAYLRRMALDPIAFRSEVEGEWNLSTSQLLDPQGVQACVVSGRREIPPTACPAPVRVYFDPSGGRHDRAAAAVGFRDPSSGRVVVAALRAWASPHNPATVAGEAAELARAYRCKSLTLDRFSGDTIAALVRSHGVAAEVSGATASDQLMDLLPLTQAGAIELPCPALSRTAAELVEELCAIERRPGGAGRDRADIPRGSGHLGHGDLAVALAGLVAILPEKRERPRLAPPQLVEAGRRPRFLNRPSGLMAANLGIGRPLQGWAGDEDE